MQRILITVQLLRMLLERINICIYAHRIIDSYSKKMASRGSRNNGNFLVRRYMVFSSYETIIDSVVLLLRSAFFLIISL